MISAIYVHHSVVNLVAPDDIKARELVPHRTAPPTCEAREYFALVLCEFGVCQCPSVVKLHLSILFYSDIFTSKVVVISSFALSA